MEYIMNKIYGTLIFFFYFVKYPIIIYLAISFYLDINNSIVMYLLGFISIILILKDLFFPLNKLCGDKND